MHALVFKALWWLSPTPMGEPDLSPRSSKKPKHDGEMDTDVIPEEMEVQ